jgi:hypothetical protein
MSEQTKYCNRCETYKPFPDGFYKNKSRADGHSNYCKECNRETSAIDRQKPGFNERIRVYRQREEVKQAIYDWRHSENIKSKKLAYDKQYKSTPQGKKVRQQIDQRRRATPEGKLKDQARLAVRNEVRAGRMPRVATLFCKCGAQAANYHHHNGYDREHWLDVIPICKKCHTQEHFMPPEIRETQGVYQYQLPL